MTKDAKTKATRRTASTHSEPIGRAPARTDSVTDVFVEITNKVGKSEQTIHELNNKNFVMEPVITKLLRLTYLTIMPENLLHERIAGVCRAMDPRQWQLRSFNAVVYYVPDRVPLVSYKKFVFSAWNMTGNPYHCFRLL